MSPRVVTRVALLAVFFPIVLGLAQGKPSMGLKEGKDVPGPFRPFQIANSPVDGRFHCPLCEHGLNPNVLLFVKNPDFSNDARWKPVLTLLTGLDRYINDNSKAQLKATVVFHFDALKDVVGEDEERIARIAEIRKNRGTLGKVALALDSLPSLQSAGYDLDPAADVVVVLIRDLKVKKVVTGLNEAAVPDLLKAIMEMAPGRKPEKR